MQQSNGGMTTIIGCPQRTRESHMFLARHFVFQSNHSFLRSLHQLPLRKLRSIHQLRERIPVRDVALFAHATHSRAASLNAIQRPSANGDENDWPKRERNSGLKSVSAAYSGTAIFQCGSRSDQPVFNEVCSSLLQHAVRILRAERSKKRKTYHPCRA